MEIIRSFCLKKEGLSMYKTSLNQVNFVLMVHFRAQDVAIVLRLSCIDPTQYL